ncbi:hypothetical protein C8N46_105210 [Kordia periserrulae]|uniref:Uncharacterized protein n=1 Tax=Kordia periserrulae TaxID=701523 RepID=A0A2T6BY86_9FLAO|nr:hypothetical protein [Kordia periserrulae]PTX61054.1 hypothetical protein C8N46_105210 [Kordia periserrulae]
MKKRNVHTLLLNKKQVSNLNTQSVKGGTSQPQATVYTCNSVPVAEGGLGCHIK